MDKTVELKKDFILDQETRVPYYYQVKKHFKNKIDSGEWKAGQMLPYENELCKRLNISRIVVRQAYQELKNEGYIISKKGKGTFISEPRIYTNWMQNFTGFYESMRKLGYEVKNKIIKQEVVEANKKVAGQLQLKEDNRVVLVKRVHMVNDEPFYLSTNYLPFYLFPGLVDEKLEQSIYKVLEKKYKIVIIRSRRFIDGAKASLEEAKFLKIKKGDFVFKVESISFLKNNIPFEYFNSIHIAEHTRLIIDIINTGSKVQMGRIP